MEKPGVPNPVIEKDLSGMSVGAFIIVLIFGAVLDHLFTLEFSHQAILVPVIHASQEPVKVAPDKIILADDEQGECWAINVTKGIFKPCVCSDANLHWSREDGQCE